jgi:hypothetical protein
VAERGGRSKALQARWALKGRAQQASYTGRGRRVIPGEAGGLYPAFSSLVFGLTVVQGARKTAHEENGTCR